MARQCFHCKQLVQPGEAHDCWTTTEDALTRDLPEHLREAWARLRETAAGFGEQRIYASHNSIMFSRRACYLFVRPKMSRLEVCLFLGRPVKHSLIHRVAPASRTKLAHVAHVVHRDEVEAPLTDWMREAYNRSPELGARAAPGRAAARRPAARRRAKNPRRQATSTRSSKPRRR